MQIYYFPIKSPSPLHPVFAGVGHLAFLPIFTEQLGMASDPDNFHYV